MHTVVCGAGFVGRRVLELLPADAVTSISRPAVDLDDPAVALPLLPADFALLYTIPPAASADSDPRLDRLLSQLDTLPARFVYISTSGVYGDRQGATVSEADPAAPTTDRARRRLAAEKRLTEWCTERGCDLVILRVPGIYGPGRLGLDRIKAGTSVIRESEASPGNRIHVDDLAACSVRALNLSSPAGIYNVGDGDNRSGSWFTKTVARLAACDAPREISLAEGEETFSETRFSFMKESRILDTSRMRNVLGFEPHYPDAETGILASLQDRD